MNPTVLIIEDEKDINYLLSKIAESEGCRTVSAFSGAEGLLACERECPDLILLDLMLPGLSGETLLRILREEKQLRIPILILSAKSALRDRVALLKTGADDYITKPFEPEEVAARIQAALRRSGRLPDRTDFLSYQNVKLYPESRKVMVHDKEISLTAHEYALLLLFLQAPEKVYSRENLYELVWQNGYYGENNTVNVHVSNLRKKLREADGSGKEYIRTVYGIGFRMK